MPFDLDMNRNIAHPWQPAKFEQRSTRHGAYCCARSEPLKQCVRVRLRVVGADEPRRWSKARSSARLNTGGSWEGATWRWDQQSRIPLVAPSRRSRNSTVCCEARAQAGGAQWRTFAFAAGAHIFVGPGVRLCWIALTPEACVVQQINSVYNYNYGTWLQLQYRVYTKRRPPWAPLCSRMTICLWRK